MQLYQIIHDNPCLAFTAFCLALLSVFQLLAWPFRLVNRWIRHRNIVAKGWPVSPFMDADGDIRFPEKEED